MIPSELSSQSDRPAEGFYTSVLPTAGDRPLVTFLPKGYEPNYPYPLVVFFHGHGSSEEQLEQVAPLLSRRNYVCIALRGPEQVQDRSDGRPGYCWGLEHGRAGTELEDYILSAIEQTRRTYHIHSERIYLAGFCEGATLAYSLALSMPERFAGIIALNGCMPRRGGPLLRPQNVRHLRVLIGHGIANAVVPSTLAKSDYRVLYNAGLAVRFRTYPATHRIHPDMLKDVNRWIIEKIDQELDALVVS